MGLEWLGFQFLTTPVATFSDVSAAILSSSPLVSVKFGKYAIIV